MRAMGFGQPYRDDVPYSTIVHTNGKREKGKGKRVAGRETSILEYRPATGFLLSSLTHNLTVSLSPPNPFYPAQSMPSGSNSTLHIHSQIDTYIMQSNSRLKRVTRITHSLQQNHKKSHNKITLPQAANHRNLRCYIVHVIFLQGPPPQAQQPKPRRSTSQSSTHAHRDRPIKRKADPAKSETWPKVK